MNDALQDPPHRLRWGFWISIAGLALLATFNSLPNGFTYDDRFIVVGNPSVRQILGWEQFLLLPYWPLLNGGDGYRPLTIFGFAVQWAISNKPALFHAVSIGLYVASCLAAFWVAGRLLPQWYAWWTAALFAVHPVHVEATSGVVGQAELAAFTLVVLATGLYVDGRQKGLLSNLRQLGIATLYLAACLFKEHAVLLPALFLGAELTLYARSSRSSDDMRQLRQLALMMSVVVVAYVLMRHLVIPLGVVGFAPYTPFVTLNISPWERLVTMLAVVPHWARLLFWPQRLSTEYGPPAYPVGAAWEPIHILGLAMVIALALAILRLRGRRPVESFAVLWICVLIAPVSNVVVPTGVLIAERTLFAASFGACLLAGTTMLALAPRVRKAPQLGRVLAMVIPGALLIFGLSRSIVRHSDWRDNEALFRATVKAEPDVYRSHYMLGAWFLETRRWPSARVELERAMELFDRDPAVAYNLGLGYLETGGYERAYELFARVDSLMPGLLESKTNMALSLAAQGRLGEAARVAQEALGDEPRNPAALHAIVRASELAARASAGSR